MRSSTDRIANEGRHWRGPRCRTPVRVSRTLLSACGPVALVTEDTMREGLSGAVSAHLRRPPRPSETETHRLTQLS